MKLVSKRLSALVLLGTLGLGLPAVSAAKAESRKPGITADMKAETARREANKKVVLAFYDASVKLDFEAARQYVGDFYIEHDPEREDGLPGLKNAFDFNRRSGISQNIEHLLVVADGDLVAVYSTATTRLAGAPPGRMSAGQPAAAGTPTSGQSKPAQPKVPDLIGDIFRLRDGKIVEHWNAIYSD